LRLRRYLGLLPEVQALSRVGAIAWGSRQREDVQIITKRLKTIQQEAQAKPPVELELLRSLGTAYEQVRDPKAAVEIYDQILAVARQQQDTAAEETTLITIGNLSLDWFDYPKAAATYRELLRMAQTRSDRLLQVTYLKQLAYIYDQSKQHQTAIQTKQQLIELFLNEQDFVQIPAIQLSIGANYEALGLVEQAAQNYQEAYAFSYQREMFTSAGEALQKLAELFQSTNQIDKALEVYQIIVTVDEQAFNIYGVMNAYDQIGRIYLSKKEYQKAIEAFQQGLAIAKQLQYRESYFAQQIEQASGSRNR
jgi:tetratricopeptide (TPR) repeat protein